MKQCVVGAIVIFCELCVIIVDEFIILFDVII